MKRWVGIVTVGILTSGASAYAFFGLDTAPIVAVLTQQLTQIREHIRVANQTLGSVRSLQRGIERLRHYRLRDLREEAMGVSPELRGVEREWRTLRSGEGSYYSANFERSLGRLYETRREVFGGAAVPERMRFHQTLAQEGLMRAGQSEGRGVKELRDQATTALEAARGAESGAEASKVGAEGNALLLRARADELQLESQQLTVQSAQLAIENERDLKSFEEREVDRELVARGLLAVEPLR